MSELFSLAGRTALITGASRGLGRAIAIGYAKAGANLVLTARDRAKLEDVAREAEAIGAQTQICTFELGDLTAVEAAIKDVTAKTRVDILVNNGGISNWAPLETSTLQNWQALFDVNVTSMYLLCREAARGMVANQWGRIINFASYVSATGRPNLSAYTASKHAVLGLTRAVAADLAPHGVTCNAIAPGFFDTDMAAPTVGNPARAKIFKSAIAMDKFGDPQEIVGPAIFLASEASAYVTGNMLAVDGGVANILSLPVVVET